MAKSCLPVSHCGAMQLLGSGVIQTEKMTTHRFPYTEAAAAFDLLYTRMNEALGVLLDWEVPDA